MPSTILADIATLSLDSDSEWFLVTERQVTFGQGLAPSQPDEPFQAPFDMKFRGIAADLRAAMPRDYHAKKK